MQLEFEVMKNVGVGNYPDLIHFANTQAQVFYVDGGELYGLPTDKIPYGEWDNMITQEANKVSADLNITNFEVKVLPGWGIIGGYKTDDTHKLIIYEFAIEMDLYLNSGSISHSIGDPVSRFNLALDNPDIKDPEKPGNIAINEESSLLSPGAKIRFYFGAGDGDDQFEMGQFFVDRSNFTLASETASVDGRNTIGKVLGDQTVDEKNEYWYAAISESIKKLFENAKLNNDEYIVENTSEQGWFSFTPNTDFKKALDTMLEVLPQWRTRELSDGTIVVGSPEYSGFDQNGIYTFYRDKDIFSRQITRDDAQSYSRVCVHTEGYSNVIFKNVDAYTGWNLQANKTLYVQVANGLQTSNLQNYADELATRLSDAGKVESFTGPFRPHLQCGDEAIIVDSKGSKSLGLITEILHKFGKSGFITDFTVDSGGTVGKGRLADYISKIASSSSGQKAEAGWNDVDMNEYANLAQHAELLTSSEGYRYKPKENMVDGHNSYWDWNDRFDIYNRTGSYWKADGLDATPTIELKLGQRCLVNKINLYFGSKVSEDTPDITNLPKGYRLQYWNNSFWVEIANVQTDVTGEPVHEFEAVETSSIRLILTPTLGTIYDSGHVREIEVWGNM